jgi:general secretion pathway protein L
MNKRLYIYLGPAAPEQVHWASLDVGGHLETGSGELAMVPHTAGNRLVVLAPGAEVLVTEVEIPGRRGRLLRQSLPYLLEENLVDEVDQLHFASGPTGPAGLLPVAAVSRERLNRWLAMLAEAGLVTEILIPATMAVPISPGQWTVVLAGQEFLARYNNWQLVAGEAENLGTYLVPATASENSQPEARIIDCNGAGHPPELAGITVSSTSTAEFMAVLVEGFNSSPYFNLLQGEFARGALWLDVLRRWRLPVVAALILAILGITSLTLDYFLLRREAARLNREITATYLRAFPGSRVVNPRAQMEQKLAALRDAGQLQGNFFTFYDKMAPLAANAKGFNLDTLRFQNNRLEMELNIQDLQTLEQLRNDLSQAPELSAEIRNAESSGGKVRARLVVEARK